MLIGIWIMRKLLSVNIYEQLAPIHDASRHIDVC